MKVTVTEEGGYKSALRGMALSYYKEEGRDHADPVAWFEEEGRFQKAQKTASVLKNKTNDHGKYLREIQIWFLVSGSRDFWQEMATYGVGSTYLSASTMHTLVKTNITKDMFEQGTTQLAIDNLKTVIAQDPKDITRIKANLPEGFIQTRAVNMSYMALRNCVAQRKGHRLSYWSTFVKEILEQAAHPELLE